MAASAEAPALPLDILARICDHLGDDVRGDMYEVRARKTLAGMMSLSHAMHDLAGRALYRTLVVKNHNFDNVVRGLKLKSVKGAWPNDASHARKVRMLGVVRHLVLHGLPRATTSTRLIQLFPATENRLFRLAKTVAITDSFAMCVARYAIMKATTPDGEDLVPPHPFFEFIRANAAPSSVCVAYPKWEDRDEWIESFDFEALRPWINLSDFNYQQEPSDFEVTFWGKIQLRRHYLGMMQRHKEQRLIEDLLRYWNPAKITLHSFDFTHSSNPPTFGCECLRIFSCEEMCEHHPEGHYSHRPLLHSGDCLANRGSYWYKARDMLRRLADMPLKPKTIELGNVGTNFLLACDCQSKFNDAVTGCKAALASLTSLKVLTPHWSEVAPCDCCTETTPRGQDTLDDPGDDPAECVSQAQQLTR